MKIIKWNGFEEINVLNEEFSMDISILKKGGVYSIGMNLEEIEEIGRIINDEYVDEEDKFLNVMKEMECVVDISENIWWFEWVGGSENIENGKRINFYSFSRWWEGDLLKVYRLEWNDYEMELNWIVMYDRDKEGE